MAETVPVTRARLAQALTTAGEKGRIAVNYLRETPNGMTIAEVRYPEAVAAEIFEMLAADCRETLQKPPVVLPLFGPSDPEATFMADAIGALGRMEEQARGRVLRYLADRYGVACGACEGVLR